MQELKHLHMVSKKDIVYPEGFPGGLKGLVKTVLEEYGKQFIGQPVEDAAKIDGGNKVDRLEQAIIGLANRERDDSKPKWEQVNLEKRLEELGLAPFFPEEVCVCLSVAVFLAG